MNGQAISKQDCQRIERALQAAKGNEALYRRIQIVHLRAAHGMNQEAIAGLRHGCVTKHGEPGAHGMVPQRNCQI